MKEKKKTQASPLAETKLFYRQLRACRYEWYGDKYVEMHGISEGNGPSCREGLVPPVPNDKKKKIKKKKKLYQSTDRGV